MQRDRQVHVFLVRRDGHLDRVNAELGKHGSASTRSSVVLPNCQDRAGWRLNACVSSPVERLVRGIRVARKSNRRH
jgi:hypothetical protein